jgi:hypothetical protein
MIECRKGKSAENYEAHKQPLKFLMKTAAFITSPLMDGCLGSSLSHLQSKTLGSAAVMVSMHLSRQNWWATRSAAGLLGNRWRLCLRKTHPRPPQT